MKTKKGYRYCELTEQDKKIAKTLPKYEKKRQKYYKNITKFIEEYE